MELVKAETKAVTKGFEWRDRHGVMHPVENMRTGHLFYVVAMIWNHAVPEEYQFPHRRYTFPDFYSKKYISDAVGAILHELKDRKDLTQDQIMMLQWMGDIANRHMQTRKIGEPK
jgi:hypothetical protein